MLAIHAGGAPVTLASDVAGGIAWMAVDATNLYWGVGQTGLVQMPKGGGPITTIYSTAGDIERMVSDGTSVYWVGAITGNYTVMKTPVGGGTTTMIAEVPMTSGSITGLAFDATSLYYTVMGGRCSRHPSGSVMMINPK